MARFRRDQIIEAAKAVFARDGIEKASLRKIAEAADATTGAIFTYYDSKQELYADVLYDSMAALMAEIDEARAAAGPGRRLNAVLGTVLEFYRRRPHDYDLSFYLFGGAQPAGLGRTLNRRLNDQMKEVIRIVADVLREDGSAAGESAFELAVSAMAHVFGVLLMLNTGRLKALRQDPQRLVTIYVDAIIARRE